MGRERVGRNEKSRGRCGRQLRTVTCEARYVSKCRAKETEEPTHWLIRDWAIARTMQKVRLMVVRSEFRLVDSLGGEDRKLLDLMIAVADLLPLKQRHELRAAL